MTAYNIQLLAVPAQNFTAQLGNNSLVFSIQWQERFGYFRINIGKQGGGFITCGRIMNVGVNLLSDLYPSVQEDAYGSLVMTGADLTPENLGIENKMVWSNV